MIGKVYKKPDESLHDIDKQYRKNIELEEYTIAPSYGLLYTGGAACGKTTQLIKDVQVSKNPVIFCFTNKAVDNIRHRLPDVLKGSIHTFDSFFNENMSNTENMKSIEGKDIFIDEFSMVPNRWITLVYHSFVNHNLKVNLYGDSNQCDPVEGNSHIVYDYMKSPAILDKCHQIVEKQYIKESSSFCLLHQIFCKRNIRFPWEIYYSKA